MDYLKMEFRALSELEEYPLFMVPAKPLTGGARIGGFNVTWPFVHLRASETQLILKVRWGHWLQASEMNRILTGGHPTRCSSGEYIFQREEIVEITKYCLIPFAGWGVQIHHSVPDYPKKMIFWYLGFPKTVITYIDESGFSPG